ncbi:MAG: pirin family protein [Myxococcota bacterium]
MSESRRSVASVHVAREQHEGGGFIVRRPFPSGGLPNLDPILLLDELGPIDYAPGKAIGAPDHPHRGMETVTYLLEGEGAHADSAGNAGTLSAGDVQWMTAGAGVVHREMPSLRMQREGGRSHGFQIWVNLPRVHKMTPPKYQEISAASVPTVEVEGARGRILAGDVLGTSAVIETFVPILIHHWSLEPKATLELPTPVKHTVAVYVFDGDVVIDGQSVRRGELAVTTLGDALTLSSETGAELMLLGGQPLEEPIAWQGPFVMNTREELMQAFADFQAGRMGTIAAEIVRA